MTRERGTMDDIPVFVRITDRPRPCMGSIEGRGEVTDTPCPVCGRGYLVEALTADGMMWLILCTRCRARGPERISIEEARIAPFGVSSWRKNYEKNA